MHITVIANGFQADYIHNLLNHLADKVDRVDFIGSPIYDKKVIDSRIVFYEYRADQEGKASVLLKSFGILNYYRKLFTHLLRSDSPIVHVQWVRFEFIEGVLLTWMMRLMGKQIIFTAHNVLPHNKTGFFVEKKMGLLYRSQNEILVHTSFIKDQIVSRFRIPAEKIHVAPHGVYKRERNIHITRQSAKQQLNLRENSKVILFFGIIQAYKGLDTLIKSIDLLDDTHNFEILVAGKVSNEFKQEFEALKALTTGKSYTYLLRYISAEEVELCFTAADVTVLPYKEASQSGVLFMSYAYGVPVIAPNIGGFSEDILPSKTGYLFEANNPASLAASIRQFDLEWSKAGGLEKRFITDFANQHYSWDASCKKIVSVYKKTELSKNG